MPTLGQETIAKSRPARTARVLAMFTRVLPGEVTTALLMALNVFLLLAACYVIKPVRDGLILAMPRGAEFKAYLGGAIALSLLVIVPLYARVASQVRKVRLVVGVTLLFAAQLVLFFFASAVPALEQRIGLVFYAWVGVFNMMVVAQFWAFANDVYSEEQGRRLFPLVGLGASLGAVLGAAVPGLLARTVGVYPLLLVSAALLVGCACLTLTVHGREARARPALKDEVPRRDDESTGSFRIVSRHRYLVLIAAFTVLFTWVNTNGEFIIDVLLSRAASESVASGALDRAGSRAWTVAWKGQFFFGVNLLSLLLQALVASRIVRHGGVRAALLVFPLVALLDATMLTVAPLLLVVRIGKTLENAVDYSINNTARNLLWLPTTTAMKYQAKQAIDTFFVRLGDVTSALTVYVMWRAREITDVRWYAALNLVLSLAAAWLALRIVATDREDAPEEPSAGAARPRPA